MIQGRFRTDIPYVAGWVKQVGLVLINVRLGELPKTVYQSSLQAGHRRLTLFESIGRLSVRVRERLCPATAAQQGATQKSTCQLHVTLPGLLGGGSANQKILGAPTLRLKMKNRVPEIQVCVYIFTYRPTHTTEVSVATGVTLQKQQHRTLAQKAPD